MPFTLGDILFLNMGPAPISVGEVVVFNVMGREIPIVHRVIKVHFRAENDTQDILTKGDNNFGDDKVLYAVGQDWLNREHIIGRAVGYLPHVGRVTIIMNDYPYVKARGRDQLLRSCADHFSEPQQAGRGLVVVVVVACACGVDGIGVRSCRLRRRERRGCALGALGVFCRGRVEHAGGRGLRA